MLVRFSFGNFRSFKESSELTLIANDNFATSPEHVLNQGGLNLLQGAFIFGVNAGGKSNFVKALEFASSLVRTGFASVSTYHQEFRIDDEPNPIGVFHFDLLIKEQRYSYTLAVNYHTSSIEAESLFRIEQSKDDFCLFERGRNEQGEFELNSDFLSSANTSLASRFNVYKEDYAQPSMARTLFLSDMVNRIISNYPEITDFDEVFNWFKRLIILSPSSSIIASPRALESKADMKFLERSLRAFDTGITSLLKTEVDLHVALASLPYGMALDIKEQISQLLLDENQTVTVSLDSLGIF